MTVSKVFTARYAGRCHGCATAITPGQACRYAGRLLYHDQCRPSNDRAADREYYQGIQDTERFHENRAMFGAETAERMEIEREMREGWD